MALSFVTSSQQKVHVVVTCDPAIKCSEEERAAYLESGEDRLKRIGEPTTFTLKALGPTEREEAEVRAGALKRSELGRLLWGEAPEDTLDRARWHHDLSDTDREAMAEYQAYINRVYREMVKAALVAIDGAEAHIDQLDLIRPESVRISTVSELVLHIQRISLLGDEGKAL